MKSSTILTISAAIFAAVLSPASAASLSTIFVGGIDNDGIMFDVAADRPVIIESFNVNAAVGPVTVEVYTKAGTFVGSEGTAAAWTLVTTQNIVNPAANAPSPAVILTSPVTLPGGTRQGFYIRIAGIGINYTSGDGVGTLEAQDPNLRIFEGTGIIGTFGGATANRIPNVTVNYSTPPNALSTPFLGSNSNDGIMFDVVATQPLAITSLQFPFATATTANVEVYTKSGTFVGFTGNAAAWTSLGLASLTSPVARTAATPFLLSTPLSLAAGTRQAFYIRAAVIADVAFTSGTALGSLATADAALQIFEGSSVSGTFGGNTPNRIPNVTIRYATAASVPPAADTAAPRVTLIGSRTVRTAAASVSLFGLATDDVAIASVRATFQGKKRKTTQVLRVSADGLFSLKFKPLPGRNRVTFVAIDASGKSSAPSSLTVLRTATP